MESSMLWRQVSELRQLADIVADVGVLTARGDSVEWQSVAADRFREMLGREASQVSRCARLLEDAAGSLAGHARAVELVDLPVLS